MKPGATCQAGYLPWSIPFTLLCQATLCAPSFLRCCVSGSDFPLELSLLSWLLFPKWSAS